METLGQHTYTNTTQRVFHNSPYKEYFKPTVGAHVYIYIRFDLLSSKNWYHSLPRP